MLAINVASKTVQKLCPNPLRHVNVQKVHFINTDRMGTISVSSAKECDIASPVEFVCGCLFSRIYNCSPRSDHKRAINSHYAKTRHTIKTYIKYAILYSHCCKCTMKGCRDVIKYPI